MMEAAASGVPGATADHRASVASIGMLAYFSADLAHHVLGHGVACLTLGGQVLSLSSIVVECSLRGTVIDLAGPFANLAVGLLALLAWRITPPAATRARLFFVLAFAFNLLWFGMQLAFSTLERTDDWAWALQQYRVSEAVRWGLVGLGALVYILSVRATGVAMTPFAATRERARAIVLAAWLAAGTLACVTAAMDRHGWSAALRVAAPQSLLLSIGLLRVPASAARRFVPGTDQAFVGASPSWIAAAAVAAAVSIGFLGPGFAVPA